MITVNDKNKERIVRHKRVRNKISGTKKCPRLNVYRSLNNIYVQLIDDERGVTLASCSTLDKEVADKIKGKTKSEQALQTADNNSKITQSNDTKTNPTQSNAEATQAPTLQQKEEPTKQRRYKQKDI